jgi:hypothetical protein
VVRYRLSGAEYRTTQGNTAPLNRRSAGEANTAEDGTDIGYDSASRLGIVMRDGG